MNTPTNKTNSKLQVFHRDNSGATIPEYAIMLALIVLVCIGGITAVGSISADMWGNSADEVGRAFTP